jgi:hypothetical protein
MVIGNEVKRLPFVLKGDVLLKRPEVVAEMKLSRRLDTAQESLGSGGWFGHHAPVPQSNESMSTSSVNPTGS